jgi:hypothetical protein
MNDLTDAIDVHVHAGPSFFDRKTDPIALAEAYRDEGVGGMILKSHFGNTHVAATLAASRMPEVEVYSSTTLNSFVGGFNRTAVEHALATDARVIWLPTFSAANFEPAGIDREFPFSDQSLSVLTDTGSVKPAVVDVVETVADADQRVALGNGHLSRPETFAILDLIEQRGYDLPYFITHADFEFMGLSVEDQVELAERGAVIEKCFLPVVHGDITIEAIIESIAAIGADNCVLSTDHGQADNQSPPTAYRTFIERLTDAGLSSTDLDRLLAAATQLVDPT